jgi:hypothetical protein
MFDCRPALVETLLEGELFGIGVRQRHDYGHRRGRRATRCCYSTIRNGVTNPSRPRSVVI